MISSISFFYLFVLLAIVNHTRPTGAESNQTNRSSSSHESGTAPTLQEVITQALQQPYPGPNGVPSKHVSDILRISAPSTDNSWLTLMCAAGDVQGCPVRKNFPGPSSRSPIRWAHVRRLASLMPSQQWAGKWWRGSDLGVYITAPMYYTDPSTGEPILQPMATGLGSLPKQHAVTRPVIEQALTFDKKSTGEVRRIERFIKSSLKDTLDHAKMKGTLERDDIGTWFQQVLNYVVFHRDVSKEYANKFYRLITPMITSFAFSNAVPRNLWRADPLGMRGIRAALFAYAEEFKPLVQKHYGHLLKGKDCSPSRSCLHQMAYGFLDSFLQAGGISIPSSIFSGTCISLSTNISL